MLMMLTQWNIVNTIQARLLTRCYPKCRFAKFCKCEMDLCICCMKVSLVIVQKIVFNVICI